MNIAVLLGGMSPERNISLLSGRAVVRALSQKGHRVTAVDPARGSNCVVSQSELDSARPEPVSAELLASFSPQSLADCIMSNALDGIDVVFIALHGRYGEDGYVQSLLDLRGIPYTGSAMLASALAMDKAATKVMFEAVQVPTPPWVTFTAATADDEGAHEECLRQLGTSVVVKPNDQGSTVGMTIVHRATEHDLRSAIHEALDYSSLALVETYVPGRELTVAVLGGEALPIIEIEPKEGFYDYQNKYTKGRTEYHCPADVPDYVAHHVQSLAVMAHEVVGCRAYSRVDFRLTPEMEPWCLEVNTIPGFTETSLVPMAAAQCGIEFGDLCETIIDLSTRGVLGSQVL
jgi:D-alanine-D-alanine ligase